MDSFDLIPWGFNFWEWDDVKDEAQVNKETVEEETTIEWEDNETEWTDTWATEETASTEETEEETDNGTTGDVEEKADDVEGEKKEEIESEEDEETNEEKIDKVEEEKDDILDIVNKILWWEDMSDELKDTVDDIEDAEERAKDDPTDKNIAMYENALRKLKMQLSDERLEGEQDKKKLSTYQQRLQEQDAQISDFELGNMKNKRLTDAVKSDSELGDLIKVLSSWWESDTDKQFALNKVSEYVNNKFGIDINWLLMEKKDREASLVATKETGVPESKGDDDDDSEKSVWLIPWF